MITKSVFLIGTISTYYWSENNLQLNRTPRSQYCFKIFNMLDGLVHVLLCSDQHDSQKKHLWSLLRKNQVFCRNFKNE